MNPISLFGGICKLRHIDLVGDYKSKESGPKGADFGLSPEGASMVFPLLRQSAGVITFRIADL
jgi:hypothetical protein